MDLKNHPPLFFNTFFTAALLILPIFALANTSPVIPLHWYQTLLTANSISIMAGLEVGKPLGIISFSYFALKTKIAQMPEGINFKQLAGVGFVGGVGFTMSIFITLLAFDESSVINDSKLSIIVASLTAGIVGYIVLNFSTNKTEARDLSSIR